MQIHGPIEPMIAKSVDHIPQAGDWRFEIKLDGYRKAAELQLTHHSAS